MTNTRRAYVVRSRYRVVGDILRNTEGILLDIGARDRRLARELDPHRLRYYSAELSGGCDYQMDLEQELDLPDLAYDYVVALDVLEHIEHIYQTFRELARITRRCLIVSLPNMATLPRRWSFPWHGHRARTSTICTPSTRETTIDGWRFTRRSMPSWRSTRPRRASSCSRSWRS